MYLRVSEFLLCQLAIKWQNVLQLMATLSLKMYQCTAPTTLYRQIGHR